MGFPTIVVLNLEKCSMPESIGFMDLNSNNFCLDDGINYNYEMNDFNIANDFSFYGGNQFGTSFSENNGLNLF